MSDVSAISWREQVTFRWYDDNNRQVLDQHAGLDFYSPSSQRTDMPLLPDILFRFHANQALPLSGEAANSSFIDFYFTRPGLKPTIYRTRRENTLEPLHHRYGQTLFVIFYSIFIIYFTQMLLYILLNFTKRYHATAMSVSNFCIVENYLFCILYFKEFTHDLIWE